MKGYLRPLLVFGLAGLPAAAHAQYTAPTYYSRPASAYGYQGAPAVYSRAFAPGTRVDGPAQTMPPGPAYPSAADAPAELAKAPSDAAPPPAVLPAGATAAADDRTKDALPAPTAPAKEPAKNMPPVFPTPNDRMAPVGPVSSAPAYKPIVLDAPGQHGECCAADCCGHEAKDEGPRFLVFGDYLYWNVHNVDVAFAQPFNGIDPFNSVPQGQVGVVSPHFASGFRFGAGVAVGDDGWLVATYTDFRSSNGNTIQATDDLVLHNFLVFPNTVNSAGSSLSAAAHYEIDLRTFDLDYRCPIVCGHNLLLEWLAGARYGHLDQKLFVNYDINGSTTVDSRINFDGGGPRVGLTGEYQICGGLYGYGLGVLDVLFGRFEGSLIEQNVFTGLVGQTAINQDRVVPILELELGAGWQSAKGGLRISAGYYVGAWFNALTTPAFINGVQNSTFTTSGDNFRDTIVFDGLVAHLELRY